MQKKFQQRLYDCHRFLLQWQIKNMKSKKKCLKWLIRRMCYVQYLQNKFYFFVPTTFNKWNCIKTKPSVIIQTLPLHSFKKMKTHTSITHVPSQHILVKSPDISSTVYCIFGLPERSFIPTLINGLWKVMKEEWQAISQELLQKNSFIIESMMQTNNLESRLSDQTFKKLVFTL